MVPAAKRHRIVDIVWPFLPHYRQRFFDMLRDALLADDIQLRLFYCAPKGLDAERRHTIELPWASEIGCWRMRVGSKEVIWQRCLGKTAVADLVIVPDHARLISTYGLLFRSAWRPTRVAFWGHGANLQQDAAGSALGEIARRCVFKRAAWWFAYTASSAALVRRTGFPESRITVLNNTIDVRQLVAARATMNPARCERLRQELGVGEGPVCLFVGGMYPEKRLGFLVAACDSIRRSRPDFEMVFVGAGPDESIVRGAGESREWLHCVGPEFGDTLVPYFMISTLVLMPGVVGLVIVDSLALEVPLVTTAESFHGPEIDYLESGVNGLMVQAGDDPATYGDAVLTLLDQPAEIERLRRGCRATREQYTLEAMVERFSSGVRAALELDGE